MILQIMFQFNPNYGSGEDVKSSLRTGGRVTDHRQHTIGYDDPELASDVQINSQTDAQSDNDRSQSVSIVVLQYMSVVELELDVLLLT